MKPWVFCEDCSWTSTAGATDAVGDGARHERTLGHGVRVGDLHPAITDVLDDLADRMYVGDWKAAQEAECADLRALESGSVQGDRRTDDSGLVPQIGDSL